MSLILKALLENDPEAQELLDHYVLFRKAASWRYEREWRLLGDRGVQDSVLELRDVTFGMRFPDALMHTVIAALESREEITFYVMHEVRGSFKLKRRPVDTGEMRDFFPRTARSAVEIFGPLIRG
jgi:hypothetical protein